MRAPARSNSAARRMSRSCGSIGCRLKYSAIAGPRAANGSCARRMTIYAAACRVQRRLEDSRPTAPMQALTGLAPLVAFFVTYRVRGLYLATAVLMAAMVLLLAFDWLRERRIPPLHALSALLVLILGAATLLLHNRLFIQWKPTVLFWAIGLAFLGSSLASRRALPERLLAPPP